MSLSLKNCRYGIVLALGLLGALAWQAAPGWGAELRDVAAAAAKRAAEYYHGQVAVHGGYVYYYSPDLQQRWGEGRATAEQVWVQPPGTPTVGVAYLRMYEATGDRLYLTAATQAAETLVYGQLQSGGWTNSIAFDPQGRVAQYRNGRGRGRNYSSLDDGQTPSAMRLLMQADKALAFRHARIHEASQVALDALLAAQFPNGAFPQVWSGPVAKQPVRPASYPDYDWRREGRIKEYWNMYTLNDNVCGYVAEALIEAHATYGDARFIAALRRLGDFLLMAQMPDPQPAWAQQYNYEMHPIWARKFEPPAIAGDESQEVLQTLLLIFHATGDTRYLEPGPPAIAYLQRSLLPSGELARFYELRTNRPLFMERRGDTYMLSYDDRRTPRHYAWKVKSQLDSLVQAYRRAATEMSKELLQAGVPSERDQRDEPSDERSSGRKVARIVELLDDQGRWIDTFDGEMLVGQPAFQVGDQYLSSATFSRNLEMLAEYLRATASR